MVFIQQYEEIVFNLPYAITLNCIFYLPYPKRILVALDFPKEFIFL